MTILEIIIMLSTILVGAILWVKAIRDEQKELAKAYVKRNNDMRNKQSSSTDLP